MYQKAIDIILSETHMHPFLASSKIGHANILARQGEYKLAEKLYLDAIAILENLYGQHHPELAKPKAALAAVYLRCIDSINCKRLLSLMNLT